MEKAVERSPIQLQDEPDAQFRVLKTFQLTRARLTAFAATFNPKKSVSLQESGARISRIGCLPEMLSLG
jgi:hypothetical protein